MNTMVRALYIAALVLFFKNTNAQERCVTPTKNNGICINIKNCTQIVNILINQKPLTQEIQEFLRASQCGFEGTIPKICCADQVLTGTFTNPVDLLDVSDLPDVSNHPNLRILNHDICGPLTKSKIIGGNKTGVFDYPWMALLAYSTGRSNPEFRCGGSLITKRYILTAGHCVSSLPDELKLIGVRIGEHDLSTERDCDKDENGIEVACAERYQDYDIENTYVHPGYTKTKLQNDIALIRLNGDADFRPRNVKPICLPIKSSITLPRKFIVTGWGATELGTRSKDLLQVGLTPVATEECKEVYKSKVEIWYKQLCAGGKRNMDSCLGDSGGPLQAPGLYNNNARFIQYGIVSFGLRNCGTEGFPGVYTNVGYYMDWILNTIRD
ncbi:hypothetical protein HZH68_007788 [Vespula germanica]|uniref:CLIP domain-containing serine protease n=1 Tax=Vespula germanica TaxID=30212 RepID=A0A834K8B2_VESGE|nr:hypothetical protein HZH68_007788 [Vespula germanica]